LTETADDFSIFNFSLFQGEAVSANISITPESKVYKYCNQDLRAMSASNFPALPDYQPAGDEWMTADQETVVTAHGSTSLIVLIAILAIFVYGYLSRANRLLFGAYTPRGKDQGILFSNVPAIDSYIPQVKSPLMVYPIILCNIDAIDLMLFNWSDIIRPHTYYDVTRDIPTILGTTDCPDMFAKVHHWPNLPKSKPDTLTEKKDNKFAEEVWYDCLMEDIVDEISV